MKMEFIIAAAVIASGLILYLTWRAVDEGPTFDTNAPQLTAPENAPTTKPPENTQPSQQK